MTSLDQSNKNIVAAFFSNYAKKIIATTEDVLKTLGAEDIKVEDRYLKFRIKTAQKAIDMTALMYDIFCIKSEDGEYVIADYNLGTAELVYTKTLARIEETIKNIKA